MPSSNKECDTGPRSGTGAIHVRSTIEWPAQGRRRRTANDGRMTKLCCRLLQPHEGAPRRHHEGTTKARFQLGHRCARHCASYVEGLASNKCFDLPSSPASGVSRSCVVALGFPSKGRPWQCHAMTHDTPIPRLITSRPSHSLASSLQGQFMTTACFQPSLCSLPNLIDAGRRHRCVGIDM